MDDTFFEGFNELDHIFLKDLYRAEEAETDPPNDSYFSNPFMFDHIALDGNAYPTPTCNSDGS